MSRLVHSEFDRIEQDRRFAAVCEDVFDQSEDVQETICPAFKALKSGWAAYRDESLLGMGGLKEVYRAYDTRSCRWVALARLRQDRGLQYYDLFIREARLIASLSHSNIINVHETGVDENDRPYFTMDLKGDTHLKGLLQAEDSAPLNELLEIFIKICNAVAYAHSRGVLHLDLKPENIQCERFGEVLVCDWGLGQLVGDVKSRVVPNVMSLRSVDNLTLMGQVRGSLGYMAPEQVAQDGRKDERTDVYALGCILHTLLCGEPPFSGTQNEVLKATISSSVPLLRVRYPNRMIPRSLEAVVLKATSRVPRERYSSVTGLKDEVRSYLNGYATQAEQPGFFREARLFLARHHVPAAIACFGMIVLTVFSVLYIQHLGRQRQATMEERRRAERLVLEVNTLTDEYGALLSEADGSRKELASQLGQVGHGLHNYLIFRQPKVAVMMSKRLFRMGLKIDPDCKQARWEQFTMNCLELRFKSALSQPADVTTPSQAELVLFAEAFPDYEFTDSIRPTDEEVVAFYRKAVTLGWKLTGFCERAFAYHHAAMGPEADVGGALVGLIEFFNGGPSKVTVTYSPISKTMQVDARKRLVLLGRRNPTSKRTLLRFASLQTLKLSSVYPFDMSHLDQAHIETLDVCGCASVLLNSIVHVQGLQELRVRPGQLSPDQIRDFLCSNFTVEVVESP